MLLGFEGQAQDDVISEGRRSLRGSQGRVRRRPDKASASLFVDAGFKLEEARIKYLVLQEIGSPEKQKTALDRLCAVNQLSKLIHDGKVAVGGKTVDGPSPKPANPSLPRRTPRSSRTRRQPLRADGRRQ